MSDVNWPETIRRCFDAEAVLSPGHARHEMQAEEFGQIADHEVYEAVWAGEVLATYPNDTPYPSVLLFGITAANRPLHLVCAYDRDNDRAGLLWSTTSSQPLGSVP